MRAQSSEFVVYHLLLNTLFGMKSVAKTSAEDRFFRQVFSAWPDHKWLSSHPYNNPDESIAAALVCQIPTPQKSNRPARNEATRRPHVQLRKTHHPVTSRRRALRTRSQPPFIRAAHAHAKPTQTACCWAAAARDTLPSIRQSCQFESHSASPSHPTCTNALR